MTAQELIAELHKYPVDTEVVVYKDYDGRHGSIDSVELVSVDIEDRANKPYSQHDEINKMIRLI